NGVMSRQRFRSAQVGDLTVDLGRKLVERLEACNVERDDELSGVGERVRMRVEVDDVAAERRAVERAAEQAEDQREPRALVAAEREQQPVHALRGIGDRAAR